MADTEKSIKVWNSIMRYAMKFPFVKVDRDSFLSLRFKEYCNKSTLLDILDTCPAMYLDAAVVEKVADECVRRSVRSVTTMSAAAGLPGGLALLGTVPADVAQFYGHVFRLAQELAYVYGYPSLTDENGELLEDSQRMLTVFVGVMSGIAVANEALDFVSKRLAEQVAVRIPGMAITNTLIYPITQRVASLIGASISKQSFAKGVSKIVPIIGGAVSGALTYVTFKPMAEKLNQRLRNDMPQLTQCYRELEDEDYQEYIDS